MNEYYPVSNFDVVYMVCFNLGLVSSDSLTNILFQVDITPSLCEIARQRFERLGWTNVRVLCMDAGKFAVPKEDGEVVVALVTMSYSRGWTKGFVTR